MVALSCSKCGAPLEVLEGEKNIKCSYCDTVHTLNDKIDDVLIMRLNTANELRKINKFVDAKKSYTNIINEYGDVVEAFFGRILANTGIEYVFDGMNAYGKNIYKPTCHRLSFTSIFEDEDFLRIKSLLKNSIEFDHYYQQAEEIENIRMSLIKDTDNIVNYDIFLCYKQTDNRGAITNDCLFGNDLYHMLEQQGYRVFFSRISLENIAGKDYEPIIFRALNSSKAMITIFSDTKYLESPWVKNEWGRYLELIDRGMKEKGSLIPVYLGNKMINIPLELERIQYLSSQSINFRDSLLKVLGEFFDKKQIKEEEIDDVTDIEVLKSRAMSGNSKAQYRLGVAYLEGEKVRQSFISAHRWLTMASENKNASAQYQLGVCYEMGLGVKKSFDTSMEWYIKAAKSGDGKAQFLLGKYYYEGTFFEQSFKEATYWFDLASEQKITEADYYIGLCYYYGFEVEQSYQEAFKWFRFAAENNVVEAQHKLGVMFENAEGVKQSYKEAFEWYLLAANAGYTESKTSVALLYASGDGIDQSYHKSFEWFKAAAKDGEKFAQFNLATMYFNGWGTTPSRTEAIKWYQLAAEQNVILAIYNLGVCYEDGLGVDQSYEIANEWFFKGAKLEDANCEFNIAINFKYGYGFHQSYEKCAEWFQKSAEHGNVEAQYNLALCYKYGQGVPLNNKKTIIWLTKAAEQGYDLAQYNLGLCYEKGQGVPHSFDDACKWYDLAAKQGNENAKKALSKIKGKDFNKYINV